MGLTAHTSKLKYLIYKTIIIFTNKLHLITYTLNKLYYRIYEAIESILRCLEIVRGTLYPIEASQWILKGRGILNRELA